MDLDGLEVLSEEECRRLLALGSLGRIGVSTGTLPAIFPVNYIVAAGDVLFFTAEGTKLHAATVNAVPCWRSTTSTRPPTPAGA